jgi:lipopolysaccharide export system permease protein
MKIIDRYIFNTVLSATALIALVLLGLQVFITLLGEMNQFGEGTYTIWGGLKYAFLTLPLNLYILFPNIALLGTLLGLGALSSHSEITVMRTSGMSITRLSFAVFWAAILMISFATILGEVLSPPLSALAEKNKMYAKSNGQILTTETGIWLRQDRSFYHIGVNYADTRVADVTRYDLDDRFELTRVSKAESGDLNNKIWQMKNIAISHITPEKVTVSQEPTAVWNMNISLGDLTKVRPEAMSLTEIYHQALFRLANGLSVGNFLLAFWQRVLQPFTTLIMIFLAIPFIFGPLRSANAGFRLLSGVMIGLGFYIFNRFFGPFSLVYQIPPFVAAVIPLIVFAAIAAVLLLRKR